MAVNADPTPYIIGTAGLAPCFIMEKPLMKARADHKMNVVNDMPSPVPMNVEMTMKV